MAENKGPKKWVEVKTQPAFQELTLEEKEEVRKAYFNDVVAPQVKDKEQLTDVWKAFDAETNLVKEEERQVEQALPEEISVGPFDVPVSKGVAAGVVGAGHMMSSVYRGTKQMLGIDEDKMADDERQMRKLYRSEYGGEALTGAVAGAIAEPLGLVIPGAKGKSLMQVAGMGATAGAVIGGASYVDEDIGQTRLGNTMFGAAAGGVISPTLIGSARGLSSTVGKMQARGAGRLIDKLETQIKLQQQNGVKEGPQAWAAAKKALGVTDEDIAAAAVKSGRKPHIGPASKAAEEIPGPEVVEGRAAHLFNNINKRMAPVGKLITPISTRIKEKSPKVFHALRATDNRAHRRTSELFHRVDPFLKTVRKLPKAVHQELKTALLNRDRDGVVSLLRKHSGPDAVRQYDEVRKVLDELYNEATQAGYKFKYLEDHYPRIVKDLEAVSKVEHDEFAQAIRKAKMKKGELSTRDISVIVNNLIRKRQGTTGRTSGSLRARKLHELDEKLLPHYAEPEEALHSYINQMVNDIERRHFFKALGYNKTPKVDGSDLTKSIQYVIAKEAKAGKLSSDDVSEMISMLRNRFGPGEQASSAFVQNFKNITYAITLGNPIAAATQLGDVALAANLNGVKNTILAMFSKKVVTKEMMGLMDAIEEFASTRGSKKLVDWALKYGGFTRVDKFGKETLLNGSLRKFKGMVKSQKGIDKFKKEWSKYFEGETDQLISDLQQGNITDNVKLLLWHQLADVQPIALSEMPEAYLKSPNGRILYTLRTFTMKQLDIMRRNIWDEMRKGHHLRAATNAAKFGTLFVGANASVDVFKDFLKGKKDTKIEDHVLDNIYTLFGLNKYTIDTIPRQGMGAAVSNFLMPPLNVYDPLWPSRVKDSPEDLWKMVPGVGKLVHERVKDDE